MFFVVVFSVRGCAKCTKTTKNADLRRHTPHLVFVNKIFGVNT